LRFRHLLEKHDLVVDMLRVVNDLLQHKGLMLRSGTAVDATLISAPSSTKNAEGERDPGLPLPNELMRLRTSHRGTELPAAAARLVRDGEVPSIR
jgi:IS5 family transposase